MTRGAFLILTSILAICIYEGSDNVWYAGAAFVFGFIQTMIVSTILDWLKTNLQLVYSALHNQHAMTQEAVEKLTPKQ